MWPLATKLITTCLFCCFCGTVYRAVLVSLNLEQIFPVLPNVENWNRLSFSRPKRGGCHRLGDQNKHTCQEGTEITELFELRLLSTKWKWYPHKRRYSDWKLSQEFKGKYYWLRSLQTTCVEMASRKRQTYQNAVKNLCTICVWLGQWMQIH